MLRLFALLGTAWSACLAIGARGKSYIFPSDPMFECTVFPLPEGSVLPTLGPFNPAKPLISALKRTKSSFRRRKNWKQVRFGSSVIEDWEQREFYDDESLFRRRMESIRHEMNQEKRRTKYSRLLAFGVVIFAIYVGSRLVGLFGKYGYTF